MPSSVKILRTALEVKEWRALLADSGARLSFVPTMGALHRGHAELLRISRERCDLSVLSIFVNPTQFGPNEDLAKYPRTFESDLAVAQAQNVDVVFAPTPDEIYPSGFSTYAEETTLTRPLCGVFRPGHFRGVTTVVLKLLNLVRPHLALFGLKDAQQFFVLHRMARDLMHATAVEGVATVREEDGLALSSRNTYLSVENRARANIFQATLQATAAELSAGAGIAAALESGKMALRRAGFEVQYLDCVELPDLAPLAPTSTVERTKPYLLAGALFLGGTRLIDNVILNLDRLDSHGIKTHH